MWLDLHVHTKWSRDSLNEPNLLIKTAKKVGLDGFAVTDHNEFEGAVITAREGRKAGIHVIMGEEIMTSEGEIIALNITERISPFKTPEETVDEIKEQGGIVLVPHPTDLRRKGLGNAIYRIAPAIDMIEGVNGRSLFIDNWRAKRLAKKLGKSIVGGSDAHTLIELGKVATMFEDGDLRKPIKIRRSWWPPLIISLTGTAWVKMKRRF